MAEIVMLNGVVVSGGKPEVLNIIKLRDAFIADYCKAKGWTGPLAISQILEIRSQDGWKNPKPMV